MARCSPSSRTVSRMKSSSSATTSSRDGSAGVAHDLAQRPRVSLRGAADHHGGCAGRREDGLGAGARGDVARGDHRHVDERDELGRQRVVGGARVHLPGRARVQRQRRGAGLDEPRARRRGSRASRLRCRGASSPRPAAATAPATAVDDPRRMVGVVEERRAGAGLRHLADGAAEVDVDDVGARRPRPCAPPRPSLPGRSRRSGSRADARRRRRAGSRASARCGAGSPRRRPSPSRRGRRRSAGPGGGTPARSRPPSARARGGSGSRRRRGARTR